MKKFKFSFLATTATIGIAVVFAPILLGKEQGLYVQGGVTYWTGLDGPLFSIAGTFESGTSEFEVDGSRAQPTVGVGYNVNEQWGFELNYVATPERVAMVPDIEILIPEFSEAGFSTALLTTRSVMQHTIVGISAVYDLKLNDRLFLIAKAGVSSTQISFTQTGSFSGIDDPLFANSFSNSSDENSTDLFGSIGLRVPLPLNAVDSSFTLEYQIVETPAAQENTFSAGIQLYF